MTRTPTRWPSRSMKRVVKVLDEGLELMGVMMMIVKWSRGGSGGDGVH